MTERTREAGKKAAKVVRKSGAAFAKFLQVFFVVLAAALAVFALSQGALLGAVIFLAAALLVFPSILDFLRGFSGGFPGPKGVAIWYVVGLLGGLLITGGRIEDSERHKMSATEKAHHKEILAEEELRRNERRD